MTTGVSRELRPRRRTNLTGFPVAGEFVLVPAAGDRVYALNRSGRAIWQLCDGLHTLSDILSELRESYEGSDVEVLTDVSTALLQFQALDLLETNPPALPGAATSTAITIGTLRTERPPIRFVFGVEDRVYFHWQLAILFESLLGQLPSDWEIVVVVCNNHAALSAELRRLLDAYGVRHLTGANHRDSHPIDFAEGPHGYVALNRVEALNVIGDHLAPDEIVCLMDSDVFLYGDLQVDLFPRGNALAANWIIGEERFFSFSAPGTDKGVDLQKIIDSLGCKTPLKRGGVTLFLTGATVANKKVIRDCFRFAQVLYLLGKVADLPPAGVWTAEMACFAMALPPNGIDCELLDTPQFAIHPPRPADLPAGSFFHYYIDPNDGGAGGPFLDSQWNKQLFLDRNFLLEDLDSFLANARSPLERRFHELARRARERVFGVDER